MRVIIILSMLFFSYATPNITWASLPNAAINPIQIYGQEYKFDIQRNGKKIGSHHLRFSQQGDTLMVNAKTRIKVKLLFLTLYEFTYDCTEVWDNQVLKKLDAVVNDNGKKYTITGTAKDGTFIVKNNRNENAQVEVISGLIFPTNHWHKKVIQQNRVLNTLTGYVNEVDITKQPPEKISIQDHSITAHRYEYSGQLQTTAWYDEQGRWVKLAFDGEDGAEIEYICAGCTNIAEIQSE